MSVYGCLCMYACFSCSFHLVLVLKDKITNNSIRDKVQRNFTVVDIIKHRKLQLFGHICCMRDKKLI